MKYLLVLAIVAVVVALMLGLKRKLPGRAASDDSANKEPKNPGRKTNNTAPQTMLACAHCGVHLPQGDATFDAAKRAYCTAAHRLAGPR
jgi:uncharacterized protein